MADDSGGLLVLLAVGLALVAAKGTFAADATPAADLSGQIGQHVTMSGLQVASVPADEGFWVDSDGGRMWVQIATPLESPYVVRPGDTVSFTGDVVAHGTNFPAEVGVTSAEGASTLAAQSAHVSIAVNAISIG
jgi:hypothetical protein